MGLAKRKLAVHDVRGGHLLGPDVYRPLLDTVRDIRGNSHTKNERLGTQVGVFDVFFRIYFCHFPFLTFFRFAFFGFVVICGFAIFGFWYLWFCTLWFAVRGKLR